MFKAIASKGSVKGWHGSTGRGYEGMAWRHRQAVLGEDIFYRIPGAGFPAHAGRSLSV
jgi:hypothetical protein